MITNVKRSTSAVGFGNQTEFDISLKKKYYLCQSRPTPMTYRDLRSVMSNKVPSSIVFLPDKSNSSDILTNSSNESKVLTHRKCASRKKQKSRGVDVYRTLVRADSRCSNVSDRELTKNDMIYLADSLAIEYPSLSPTSGFFHPQNSPNILKHRMNNNNSNHMRIGSSHTKSSYSSSPSLKIQHARCIRRNSDINNSRPYSQHTHRNISSPLMQNRKIFSLQRENRSDSEKLKCNTIIIPEFHNQDTSSQVRPLFITPPQSSRRETTQQIRNRQISSVINRGISTTSQQIDCERTSSEILDQPSTSEFQYDETNNGVVITTTTLISPSFPSIRTRKELHVYMPPIVLC